MNFDVSLEEFRNQIISWFNKSIYPLPNVALLNESFVNEILKKFQFDYKKYFPQDTEISLRKITLRAEIQGILLYRIARELFLQGNPDCDNYAILGRSLSGFEIYYSATIGAGLKINHGLGTVIGARVEIGENCLIHQGVTFGDKDGCRPKIGNNVIVYAGAKLIGNITVGDNAIIGANTVCFIDVPENKIAVGIPSKIIS
jgi:serine O-acetyltransferase